MKKIFDKKIIFGFVLGIMVSCLGVYASTQIASSNVLYNNESSGLTSTNVNDALDELYSNNILGKNSVATALQNKGFDVNVNSTYTDLADAISDLPIIITKDESGNYSYKLEGSDTSNNFENQRTITLDTILYNGVSSKNGIDYYGIYGCSWSGTSLSLNGNAQGPMFDNNSGHTAIIIVKGNANYAQFRYGNKSGSLPTYQNTGANRENFETINSFNGYTLTVLPNGKRFFFGSGSAGGTIYAIYSIVLND